MHFWFHCSSDPTFDKIYVLDLHGNTKKKEMTPDGKPDNNVFDIQQGVAIIIAVKKRGTSEKMAVVHHGDLWGSRESKYQALFAGRISTNITQKIECRAPHFAFVPRSLELEKNYSKGFLISDLFLLGTMGIQTSRDGFAISHNRDELISRLKAFTSPNLSDDQIRQKFFGDKKSGKYLPGDSRGWSLSEARKRIDVDGRSDLITRLNYRPFDVRFTYFSKDLIDWPRESVMVNFLRGKNLSLLFPRQLASGSYYHIFVTDTIAEMCVISNRTKEQNAVYPLYLYPDDQDLDKKRRVNFDHKIFAKLKSLAFHQNHGEPDEVQVFDYIYV